MPQKANILLTDGRAETTIQFHVISNERPEDIGYLIAREARKMKTRTPKYLARRLDAYYEREGNINIHVDNDYLYIVDMARKTIECFFCLMFGIGNREAVEAITVTSPKAPRLAIIFSVPFGATKEDIKASVNSLKKQAERKHALLVRRQEKERFDGAIFEIEDFNERNNN